MFLFALDTLQETGFFFYPLTRFTQTILHHLAVKESSVRPLDKCAQFAEMPAKLQESSKIWPLTKLKLVNQRLIFIFSLWITCYNSRSALFSASLKIIYTQIWT